MAIEIIPRVKIKKISWVNIIFYLLLVLVLAFVISYLILIVYQKKLNQELEGIEKALIRTPEEDQLEKEILNYEQKIKDFGILITAHQFPVKLFQFLEKNTHPKIRFSKFTFDAPNNRLELSGQTPDFEVLGQQMIIFQQQEFVKKIDLTNVSITKDKGIGFSLSINLDPQIFTQFEIPEPEPKEEKETES